jgi:hypothetical protein
MHEISEREGVPLSAGTKLLAPPWARVGTQTDRLDLQLLGQRATTTTAFLPTSRSRDAESVTLPTGALQ